MGLNNEAGIMVLGMVIFSTSIKLHRNDSVLALYHKISTLEKVAFISKEKLTKLAKTYGKGPYDE